MPGILRVTLRLGLTAAALLVPAGIAGAQALPDLVADPPARPSFETSGGRLLLRFDGFVHNRGAGALELFGSGRMDLSMTSVEQRFTGGGSTPVEGGRIVFQPEDGHAHWHFQQIASYSLVGAADDAEVGPAQKVGFCLLDSFRVEAGPGQPPAYQDNCAQRQTDAPSVRMGVSAGWRDHYGAELPFQYVDVSQVTPGPYRLRSDIDEAGSIVESDEVNPPGHLAVVVPGYVARAGAVAVRADGPTLLRLPAAAHAGKLALGARELRIEALPAHGELRLADGTPVQPRSWFADQTLRYLPDDPARPDELTFAVREAGSPFPSVPPTATLLLGAGDEPAVAISGVRPVVAGTALQLSATAVGAAPGDVEWATSAGSVDATGLLVAPADVPPGGVLAVRATLSSGATDEEEVPVVPAPDPEPLPSPAVSAGASPAVAGPVLPGRLPSVGPVPGTAPTPALAVRAVVSRGRVSASALTRFTGRVRLSVMRNARRLSSCDVAVRPGRTAVCRLSMRGAGRSQLRVVGTLRRPGRPKLTRVAKVATASARPVHQH